MYKVGKIINQEGQILETVYFNVETKEIQYYELKDGEMLVENDDTKGYVKPKWTGTDWIESATPEEIEEPEEPKPTEMDLLKDEITELKQTIDIMLGGEVIE